MLRGPALPRGAYGAPMSGTTPVKLVAPRTSPVTSNSVGRGFGLLGDEWTLFLLRFALEGMTRYSDFHANLPISHAVLTNRLDNLVREGLMSKQMYQERPPRSEYILTAKGRATWPILIAIWGWERTWVRHHSYDTPPMHHKACDKDFTPVLACAHCKQPVVAYDLVSEFGPTGGWRESVAVSTTRRRSESRSNAATHSFYPGTMAVFGNRWSAALIGAAFLRVRRFTEFQSLLGAPPGLLADRLNALCASGFFEPYPTSTRPDWAEYRLSEKGIAFLPVVVCVIEWAERWLGDPAGPALLMTHKACGTAFHPMLVCDQCGEPLHSNEIAFGSD